MTGTVHGVGVGPGDPELMSRRAERLIRGADVIAYFRKAGRPGHARRIVDGLLKPGVVELPLEYPVTTEIGIEDPAYAATLAPFYDACAERLIDEVTRGRDVIVPCEGDPFFYGSFMHLHSRLSGRVPVSVVPGITGMSGCWTASGQPITWGDDALLVLQATMAEAELTRRMRDADALVVMKIGRNLGKVRRALAANGLLERAVYVERGTMSEQRIEPLATRTDDAAPYFAMVLVHGRGRRP